MINLSPINSNLLSNKNTGSTTLQTPQQAINQKPVQTNNQPIQKPKNNFIKYLVQALVITGAFFLGVRSGKKEIPDEYLDLLQKHTDLQKYVIQLKKEAMEYVQRFGNPL